MAALDVLKKNITKTDRKLLGDAFQKAGNWVKAVAEKGGTPPRPNKRFTKRGVSGKEARVDIEVQRGPVNLVKE